MTWVRWRKPDPLTNEEDWHWVDHTQDPDPDGHYITACGVSVPLATEAQRWISGHPGEGPVDETCLLAAQADYENPPDAIMSAERIVALKFVELNPGKSPVLESVLPPAAVRAARARARPAPRC